MRFVTFEHEAGHHIGAVIGNGVVDLNAADLRLPNDMGAYLRGRGALADLVKIANSAKVQHTFPLNTIKHCLPVRDPGKIFCLGLNYLEHVKEGNNQVVDYPTISDKLDFEAELVLVIGKRIRHATKETALSAIAGYSCFNDGTLRDYQRRTTQ